MNLTSRKLLVFTLLSAASLAVIASCSDDTSGPPIPRAGYLAIAPSFNSNAAFIVEVAIVAILLERTVDGSIVVDTAIALELGADSVDISLTVPVLSNDDTFLLTLSLIDTAGDTVFRGEPQTVTPSLTGGTDAAAVLVPLFYTGVGSNAAALVFLTTNPTVFFGDSVELTAVALDSAGQVIANTPIAFTSLDTLRATVPDKAVGIVVGGLARGGVLIEAKLLTGQSDTVVVTVQPVPSALLLTSGDGQTGTVGTALADSLAVKVIAADGLGVAGVTVLFSSADITASLSAGSVTTDAQGLAAVSWTLGAVAGGQQVIAAVSGIANTVSFTATAQALAPAQLAFTVEPSTTTAGAAITPAVVVTALDALGNTDASFAGNVTVAIGTNPSAGTLSGTATVAAVAGVATFSTLSLDKVGTSYTLTAGAASQLAFTVEPSTGTATVPITPAAEVTALDAFGNTATGFSGSVAMAIGANPGGGTLSGTTPVAAAAGVAAFSDLSIDKSGTGYTLSASAPGVTSATSSAFNITAGAPAVVALDGGDGQRTTVGATLPQSLTVNVTDAGGNPASGVSVTWTVIAGGGTLTQPTTVTNTAGIATNQWQLGGAFGANGAQASVTGLSGSPVNFTALATPVGMTKLWVGVTTDWASATNWDPAGVPAATDNVFVPAAAVNQPVLSANQSVGDLLLETGATLDVSTFAITASGDVSAGTAIIGTGTVALTGSGKTVSGSLPNVTVSSDITVAGNTVVTGNLTVTGATSNLTLNGKTVTVTGSFTTQSSGVLTMISGLDVLDVAGAVTFVGASTVGLLTAGELRVQGNFTQNTGSFQSFQPSGTHKVLFNGTLAQTISFTTPSTTNSRFQELTINNAAGVSFSSTAFVTGTATLAAGAGSVTGTTVTIAGDLVDTPGSSWLVTNTIFSGSPALPLNLASNITFTGAATLATNLNLTGNLTVLGAGANLTLNGQSVLVTGSFTTLGSSVLTMTNVLDVLDVAGDVTFVGASTVGLLSAGELRLQGNFTQTIGSFQSFQPSGTHKVLFNGTLAQTINFSTPATSNSRFQELTISNAAGVSFISTAFVTGTATLAAGAGSVTGTTVTVAGDLVDTPGSSWLVTNTTFSGSPALPLNMATNIMFTGAVTLATNLTLTGNLTVSGNGSNLIMNGKTVTVSGSFTTQSSGVLTMTNFLDVLSVQGNILFAGGNTGEGSALCPAAGCITDGTINASGNFTQAGSAQSFHARLFNEVRFVGTAAQSLSFANPADGANSHFANVRFDNVVGVTLLTNIYAHCDLSSLVGSTAIIIGNGNTFTVGGLFVNALKLDRVLLVYDGIPDAHSTGSFSGFSNVEFANYLGTDIQMTVEDAGATLTFSGITLSTTPTDGLYIQARDSDGVSLFLTINIASTPSNCVGSFESELNGAVVNWINC